MKRCAGDSADSPRPAEVIEPTFRNWGDTRDQHLVGDWYPRLPPRVVDKIRPLAAEYARWLWENVFVSVKNPFDPRKATGWMAKVFQSRERQQKLAEASSVSLKGVVLDQFKWAPDADVFVLHAPEHGYQTTVTVFLEYSERFFGYFDNGVACHPTDQNVVVYWDSTGPWFGKRRDRCLASV